MGLDKYDSARQIIRKRHGVKTAFEGVGESFYGVNNDVSATREMIWNQGGIENLLSVNGINRISSSNIGDSQKVLVQGHTISTNGFTYISQELTLNGRNKVTIPTPLARIDRLMHSSGSAFAGNIYAYEDDTLTAGVPNTPSKIHIKVVEGNQSGKATLTIDKDNYFIMETLLISVLKNTSATADFWVEVKDFNSVWRLIVPISVSSGTFSIPLLTPAVFQPNQDIRLTVTADSANSQCSCYCQGFLMKKV